MDYIISVVVPTKNRYQYLKYLIKLIDSFKLPELEFVIQDNSDNNTEILDYLKEYDNPNIKYYFNPESLTMSQNGELAIKHAEGKYVCYIGDDDGVCRNIVDCVKWMKTKGIDAVYNNNVWFMWGQSAKLLKPSKGYKVHDTAKELCSLVKKGCDLSSTRLPLIYHGIVRKAVLEDIIARYGTLFPSVPPDIAGSICLASVIKDCVELRVPVIINGISQMAGGGVVSKGGVLKLEDVAFITQSDIDNWEMRVPKIWCGSYAWANSGIKALEFVGLSSLSKDVNIDRCLAKAVSLRPNKNILWKMGYKYSRNKLEFLLLAILGCVKKYLKKIWKNRPWSTNVKQEVENIIEAEEFFMKHVHPLP